MPCYCSGVQREAKSLEEKERALQGCWPASWSWHKSCKGKFAALQQLSSGNQKCLTRVHAANMSCSPPWEEMQVLWPLQLLAQGQYGVKIWNRSSIIVVASLGICYTKSSVLWVGHDNGIDTQLQKINKLVFKENHGTLIYVWECDCKKCVKKKAPTFYQMTQCDL